MPTNSLASFRLTRRAAGAGALLAGLGLTACSDSQGGDPTTAPTTDSSMLSQPSVSGTQLPSGSANPSASGSSSPSVSASTVTNLDAITVTGAYGATPKVTAAWPLTIASTQTKVLIPGKGTSKVAKGGTVLVNYHGVNARNGQMFDSSFTKGGKPVAFPLDQVIAGFRIGLEGQQIGSRVLIMMAPKDGYAQGNSQAGILPTDSLIFVVDIVSAQLEGPEGTAVTPAAGLPTVKDNGKGKAPTITVGSAAMPDKLVVQPLIKGTGPAVKLTDGIVVNYTAVSWKSGDVLAQNYSTGPEQGVLGTLIPGWQKGLVNQTVGSRVLLVVPPADAYPKGNATPSIPANETLVYVVDILFASAAQ